MYRILINFQTFLEIIVLCLSHLYIWSWVSFVRREHCFKTKPECPYNLMIGHSKGPKARNASQMHTRACRRLLHLFSIVINVSNFSDFSNFRNNFDNHSLLHLYLIYSKILNAAKICRDRCRSLEYFHIFHAVFNFIFV